MAVSATTASTSPPAESSGYRWLALIAVIVGAFVAILNNSLINVALPKLTNVFGSTTDRIQWVLTGYMLASGVIIPISGYMGDRLGYKKFFIISLGVFTLGTLFCALAWSDTSLIIARIIAGLGGGVIMPISMSIIYKIMPREQIGTALGLWGVSAMVAPAVGPTLSGYLIELFNWRFLFIINIPVAVLAIVLVSVLLKETETVKGKAFDTWGFLLAATSAGTLLYALSNGQSKGWTSFEIVALFFVSFWSLVFLLWVETGKKDPIIDLSLFKNFTYTLSIIAASLVTIGLFGGVFLTPIFLQNIQGVSPIDTGIILIPQAIAMAIMMPIAGRLFDKVGVIPLGLIGLILMSIMTYELHRLTVDTPFAWLETVLAIRGIGIGLCMMPLSTAGMNAVAPQQVGNASSLSNLIRQVASSMGIAVLTALMQQRTTLHAQHIAESVSETSVQYFQSILGTSTMSSLGGIIQREAMAWGIADTFLISSLPLFITIPLVLLFKKRKKAPEVQAS
ncbi:DHA2 family efflux MFS transporter permease subunit [Aneurinibacillus migulanus]|uniref:DHA2 family efflux MFS transporter permease subunit n=1 Tax=Aneurinibacillus migulanus TaxID=47500 RepID=UPI0006A019F6|nr:Drug resistance MFS transporter, drug:H+ antiport er-2 family [Aneurinibacillus migulanus]CEH32450.1 Drug resistance MFS transporter, drug:H+ antiport er-2 family [Aneurinibacillus migulanus]